VKIFRVGGSVRDEILGRPIVDRDYVVVGATPEEMIAQGFRPVGRDFPVFIHPESGEEYALARTERKSGRGYHGFTFHVAPEVTLEEDLSRRDLTINAMARDPEGALIDPYGGERDLRARILRHVSPAFAEDPLRVLRVARFAARFDFKIAPETEALMRAISTSGEVTTLVSERVWEELSRALMEMHPSRFFVVLRRCGALLQLLPEVDALFGVPQPLAHHPELDVGVHVLQALDYSAAAGDALPVRYAVLTHDLGKGVTPCADWPRHIGHEQMGARLTEAMSERLRAPADCRELALLAARHHGSVHRAMELRPATLLDLLQATDALRRPERLAWLLRACEADALSRPGRSGESYAPTQWMNLALATVRSVDAGAIARDNADPERLPGKIREARIDALRAWRETVEALRPEP
jgi:tRNA nucleotidyltransferase (CCA-adding enzyme)